MARTKKPRLRTPKHAEAAKRGILPLDEEYQNTTITEDKIREVFDFYGFWFPKNIDRIKFVKDFAEKNGHENLAKKIKQLPNSKITTSTCWVARLRLRNVELPLNIMANFMTNIEELEKLASLIKDEEPKEESLFTKKSKAEEMMDYLYEDLYEVALKNAGAATPLDTWFLENQLNQSQANELLRRWTIAKQNAEEDYNYIVNDYKSLGKTITKEEKNRVVQATIAFKNMRISYEIIIKKLELVVANNKAVRKPRKKNPAVELKKLDKVQYQEFDPELNIKSMPISNVVGKTYIIAYNAKYRVLTLFKSNDPKGISFKGQTGILGIDEAASKSKKLRKPADVIPKVMTAGKREIENIFKSLTTTETSPNATTNNFTLFLRAF
jgi:hypothetical protein